MFNFEDKKLEGLGAIITTKEIKQQPKLWAEAYEIYKAEVPAPVNITLN